MTFMASKYSKPKLSKEKCQKWMKKINKIETKTKMCEAGGKSGSNSTTNIPI